MQKLSLVNVVLFTSGSVKRGLHFETMKSFSGLFYQQNDGRNSSAPSLIVIGRGISGIASARALSNACSRRTQARRLSSKPTPGPSPTGQ